MGRQVCLTMPFYKFNKQNSSIQLELYLAKDSSPLSFTIVLFLVNF
jgi:hypothetical protein